MVALHPTPYTLHPAPYTLHHAPYTLHPTRVGCKCLSCDHGGVVIGGGLNLEVDGVEAGQPSDDPRHPRWGPARPAVWG